jgi:hypothetical protein
VARLAHVEEALQHFKTRCWFVYEWDEQGQHDSQQKALRIAPRSLTFMWDNNVLNVTQGLASTAVARKAHSKEAILWGDLL